MMIHNKEYIKILENLISYTENFKEQYFNKTFLITGATGLIGTLLVDFLMYLNKIKGAHIRVVALGRDLKKGQRRFSGYFNDDNFIFEEHDLMFPISFKYDVDFVIHAASNTHPIAYSTDPLGTVMINVQGTSHVLDYVKDHPSCKVVYLSTVEIYGENRGDVEAFDENYCGYINCNTLRANYPESKRLCESLCQSYRELYDLQVFIIRLCRVYGPTVLNTDSKASSQFLRNALDGEDIVLKSKGDQCYSYIYVADVITAIFTILFKGNVGEAYNVSDDRSNVKLSYLAELIAKSVSRKVVFDLPDISESKGFSVVTKAVLDSYKLRKLGWKPIYTLENGIQQTINILRDEKASCIGFK